MSKRRRPVLIPSLFVFPRKRADGVNPHDGVKLYDLLSPFLVFSTTSTTMAGIRHIGVMTRAKMTLGGGSLSVSMGHSWKKEEWISTNMSSTSLLGHGSAKHSAMPSEHMVKLLQGLQERSSESVYISSQIFKTNKQTKSLQCNRNDIMGFHRLTCSGTEYSKEAEQMTSQTTPANHSLASETV